ncbi:hypothetical protein GW17_00055109 [Ensete ventricosum]|nr:hypothetical protein GW17_00055109 [Ensete ventricosum]
MIAAIAEEAADGSSGRNCNNDGNGYGWRCRGRRKLQRCPSVAKKDARKRFDKASLLYDQVFSLPSGKASYRPVHTDPARYIPIRQLTGTWTGCYWAKKRKRRKKKYLVAILACAPSPPAGRPRDAATLAARGRLSSPRGETFRLPALGERPRRHR